MHITRYSCQILTFPTDFLQIFKYQISWKSVHWEPRCSKRTDRLTERRIDRHDKANSRFSRFYEEA